MADGYQVADGRASGSNGVPPGLKWSDEYGHVPDWIYTDPTIYVREQERIFRGRSWNYVGLEAEVPAPGDYIRSYAGSYPVVVTRDQAGEVRVFENRCAHRGVEFCRALRGNTTSFMCPYHQWTYDLTGQLIGVPFRRGIAGNGGMPASFDMGDFNLLRLKVECRGGVIFASFCQDMEPLADYIGPEIVQQFDTFFTGRKLKVLGRHRNTMPSNWKLYMENLKDAYHATLLHSYLTTFGLFVADNKTQVLVDQTGRHHVALTARPATRPKLDENKAQIGSFREAMPLHDPRVIKFEREFSDGWSAGAFTIWPNLVTVRQTNILGNRHIVPIDANNTLLIWTSFGFADESEEMTEHRLRQNNIFGPGGFLGIDDNEVLKFAQDGLKNSIQRDGVLLLGDDNESIETTISERQLRAMYRYYREVMEL